MQHLDEGTIHAWLDGELPSPERETAEAHLAECAQCAAAVAEARGFIAASTRILTALDSVPAGVLPAISKQSGAARPAVRRRFMASRAWMAAAAVLVLSTVTVIAIRPGGDAAQLRVAAATRDKAELPASTAPSEEKLQAKEPSAAPNASDSQAIGAVAPVAAPAEGGPATNAVSRNAPATMELRKSAPTDEPKSVDQNERLKSRLEAERQSTRARPSNGAAPGMADAAPPARAPEAPAPMARLSEQPAAPPTSSVAAKDALDKRADVVSPYATTSAQRTATSAEGVSISGRVTRESGAPLASASVTLEGAGTGTITREDGSYALFVPLSRANGKTISLVARLIGYKTAVTPIAPTSAPITHDFVLGSNPVALSTLVITGAGTTSASEKLGAVALDSNAVDSAAPRLLSRNTIRVAGDTVVKTIYSVLGVSVSLTDHSRARDEARRPQVRGAVSEMPAKSNKAAAAVNSISWSDSTGHTRTLRGPLTTEQLEQLKTALFGATP
ncbi:MAG: carboxypeptidase-like regulatory domain-containing protein [Gemmatimonadota bacterium]|nr:carboxypeptidase-like regulatory domain-containing protein [Gemmatimonadota bacterium]